MGKTTSRVLAGAVLAASLTGLGGAGIASADVPRVLQPKLETIQPKHEHPQYPTSASCPICKENGVWKRQV
ncbi:hypothetical protein [Gordonia alkanivorans]|uniref:hypothetical protein n=1 Tax=Gordonia alkanivorans TaxID=84096 RepID=UPI0004B59350|nr:hypothetical protein [Gordonia alkanivorans]